MGFTLLLNRVPSGKFNRVKVNVVNQLPQIESLLADNRFACPARPVKCLWFSFNWGREELSYWG